MRKNKEITFDINSNGCHLNTSHKTDKFGYPRLSVKRVNTPMHRFIYEINNGKIPDGLVVMHSCDTPQCINVKHLSLGTIQDNVADRHRKGRTSRASRGQGESGGMSKLKNSDILEIRKLRGKISQPKIAKIFGISQTHVSGIQLHRYWAHIGGGS